MSTKERLAIRGIICASDGQVKPFSSELGCILRALEAAALVGLQLKLEPDQVKLLHAYVGQTGRPATTWAVEGG